MSLDQSLLKICNYSTSGLTSSHDPLETLSKLWSGIYLKKDDAIKEEIGGDTILQEKCHSIYLKGKLLATL